MYFGRLLAIHSDGSAARLIVETAIGVPIPGLLHEGKACHLIRRSRISAADESFRATIEGSDDSKGERYSLGHIRRSRDWTTVGSVEGNQ